MIGKYWGGTGGLCGWRVLSDIILSLDLWRMWHCLRFCIILVMFVILYNPAMIKLFRSSMTSNLRLMIWLSCILVFGAVLSKRMATRSLRKGGSSLRLDIVNDEEFITFWEVFEIGLDCYGRSWNLAFSAVFVYCLNCCFTALDMLCKFISAVTR